MAVKLIIRDDLGTGYLERLPRLRKAVERAMEERRKKGLPIVYRNEFCVKPNQFIHEYPDGRKFLIEQDPSNSEEKVIKRF